MATAWWWSLTRPARTFRRESYEEYKAGRAPTPRTFPPARQIKELVDLLGLGRLEVPGYEADDVIGTLARRAEAQSYPVRILTGDGRTALAIYTGALRWCCRMGGSYDPGCAAGRSYGVRRNGGWIFLEPAWADHLPTTCREPRALGRRPRPSFARSGAPWSGFLLT